MDWYPPPPPPPSLKAVLWGIDDGAAPAAVPVAPSPRPRAPAVAQALPMGRGSLGRGGEWAMEQGSDKADRFRVAPSVEPRPKAPSVATPLKSAAQVAEPRYVQADGTVVPEIVTAGDGGWDDEVEETAPAPRRAAPRTSAEANARTSAW